jgi:hypothetical protein
MHTSSRLSGVLNGNTGDQMKALSGVNEVEKLQGIVRVVCPMDASHHNRLI